MDPQVRGQLATITFALGKLIRSTSRTAEQRQDEVERLRSWADHQLKEAYRAGADSAGLTPEQQAFLSGVHDTVDQLAWLIDSPFTLRAKRAVHPLRATTIPVLLSSDVAGVSAQGRPN